MVPRASALWAVAERDFQVGPGCGLVAKPRMNDSPVDHGIGKPLIESDSARS